MAATRLSTDLPTLVTVLDGALLEDDPPDRTVVAFNRNLNDAFVLDGGVAVTVIAVPAVAELEDTLIDHPDCAVLPALRTLKSVEEIPTTFAPLNVKLPERLVPPLTLDQAAVATVGLLSTVSESLVTVLAGALLVVDPSDRTLVAFSLNLNEAFVLAGGVAVTVTFPPDETELPETLIDQPV